MLIPFFISLVILLTSAARASSPAGAAYTIVELNGAAPVLLGGFHAPPVFVGDTTPFDSIMGNTPRQQWDKLLRQGAVGSTHDLLGQLGDSGLALPMRAVIYHQGHLTILGALPGGLQSQSRAVNRQGQVVGWSEVSANPAIHHAFLHIGGRMVDLNAFLPAHSGWLLCSAESINDFGQIAGSGEYHGGKLLFLLTPTHLSAEQRDILYQQMLAKKQAADELRRPKSNLERLGPIAAHILEGATRVETFRVELPKGKENAPRAKMEGTVITASGPVLGETAASQISGVLRDLKPYLVISQPACLMRPAVIFRIWKEKSYVDVVICFHCGQIVVRGYDDSGKRVSDMYGLMTDEETQTFKALAKQAFAQDAVIQAL